MKKIITIALIVIMLSASAGIATYAWFTSSATSTNNTFTAGTLKMDSMRDDLPITGPMFYTESTVNGMKGTGYWEPGKSQTRTIFITNTGSLPAKLSSIKANLLNSEGMDPAVKNAFLRDMNITTRYAVNTMRNNYTWLEIDVFKGALESAQATFEAELANGLQNADSETILSRMDAIYDAALDKLSIRDKDHIIHGYQPMSKYVAGYNSTQMNQVQPVPILQPGDTVAIIYNAWLTNHVDQNILQGHEFDFDFVHTFGQTNQQ